MCFRPGVASKTVACPGCGKKLTLNPGATPEKCPFCGAPFPKEAADEAKTVTKF